MDSKTPAFTMKFGKFKNLALHSDHTHIKKICSNLYLFLVCFPWKSAGTIFVLLKNPRSKAVCWTQHVEMFKNWRHWLLGGEGEGSIRLQYYYTQIVRQSAVVHIDRFDDEIEYLHWMRLLRKKLRHFIK